MKNYYLLKILGFTSLFLFSGLQFSFAAPSQEELSNGRHTGLAYLIQNQNGDGSWGQHENEKVRVTATVLDVLDHYNISGLVYSRGLNWLSNSEASCVEDLARKYQLLHNNGIAVVTDELMGLGYDTTQGVVWGAKSDHRYSTFDTTESLKALMDILPSADIDASISYLKGRRNTSSVTDSAGSGWANSNSRYNTKAESQVLPTAQVLLLLHKLGGSHWGASADRSAAHWLALQQYASGAIADSDDQAIIETAVSAQALGVAKDVVGADPSVLTAYENSLDYLLSAQATNGSVENNLLATAVVTKALFPQQQTLTDTDMDVIPDDVELIIGTDPFVADSEYLETGNGINTQDSYGGYHIYEFVVGVASAIQLDESNGTLFIDSGSLPQGIAIRDADNSLVGTPIQLGSHSISYLVLNAVGTTTYHGTALIRVVSPESDSDGDGISASYETQYPSALSSLNSNDANLDADGDGLTNYMEYVFGTNPTLVDSDGDGINDLEEMSLIDSDSDNMPDHYEIANGLNPYVADDHLDLDNDGVTNYDEFLQGLLPNNPDTDGDGLLDGEDPHPLTHRAASLLPSLLLMLFEEKDEPMSVEEIVEGLE